MTDGKIESSGRRSWSVYEGRGRKEGEIGSNNCIDGFYVPQRQETNMQCDFATMQRLTIWGGRTESEVCWPTPLLLSYVRTDLRSVWHVECSVRQWGVQRSDSGRRHAACQWCRGVQCAVVLVVDLTMGYRQCCQPPTAPLRTSSSGRVRLISGH